MMIRNATRRERNHQRIRGEIAAAAARVLARDGFAAATMQAIAEEAGYTAASLYEYFPGKQAVVDALARDLAEQFVVAIDAPVPAGLPFEARLQLLLHRLAVLGEQRRDAVMAWLQLRLAGGSGSGADRAIAPGASVRELSRWLAENAPRELLSRRSAKELAVYLQGLRLAQLLAWLESGSKKGGLEAQAAGLAELFLHGAAGVARSRGEQEHRPRS